MPVELNIQPKKRPDLKGMLRHDFRQYERDSLPKHIDPERQGCNRVLCGDPAALEDLPERQPETSRKIRKDANVAASMVMTLPQELDPDNPDQVEAWPMPPSIGYTNSAPDGSPTACSTRTNHGHTRTPQSFPKTRKDTAATKSPSTE